jgi:hypothetical protein
MNSTLNRVAAAAVLLSMTLTALPVSAQTGSITTKTKTATRSKPTRRAVTAEDIRELRQMLEQQQRQIEQLRQQLNQRDEQARAEQQAADQARQAADATAQKAEAAQSASRTDQEAFTQMKGDVADLKTNVGNVTMDSQERDKRISGVEGALARFRWSGDVRVRQEDFFFGCTESATVHCPARVRQRIRVRFGFEGKLGEDFVGGVALASGVLFDPTTTNETLTNNFERKTIGFDRGYITYNPHSAKWLSLTGGKFAFTWQRTSVTFDPDLNPEGFSEKLAWEVKNPVVKNLSVTGMQLFFNEASGGNDSFAAGGQIASKLQFGQRWTMTPSYTILNWRNQNVLLNEPTSVTGSTTVGPFAPNGVTNATVGSGATRTYLSDFLYSDVILNNQVKTGIAKLPFNLLAEYENNLRARMNASKAYLLDASVGQTVNKGDFQLGYAWLRQEQDSVISSFNESDQRAPTNVLQHRFYFLYKMQKNTTLSYTQWIGRTLDSNLQNASRAPGVLPGQQDPFLKRMQFDVVYSF